MGIFTMKFVYDIYIPVIILRFTFVVQNAAADFTLEELTHISKQLKPIECMRLLEAIYFAISSDKGNGIIRETPVNAWSSEKACLDELKTWNHQFSDEIDCEPKARIIMILHLNALGRSDLANYVLENQETIPSSISSLMESDEENHRGQIKMRNHRIFRRDTSEKKSDRHIHAKRVAHGVKRAKIYRRNNQYNDIHYPMIATISGGSMSNGGDAGAPEKRESGKWKHAISKNSLFLLIALGIVVILICGIVFLIFRRSSRHSVCPGERSDLCPGNNTTKEKGLQCIRCLNDYENFETQSNMASQISEIDVEGGSCINATGLNTCKSFSTAVLCNERNVPKVSMEEPIIKILKEVRPLSSCRCRTLETKICGPVKSKKKKKKSKAVKSKKDGAKTNKNYLKVMLQDKILPRKGRKLKKECTFDTKQFQEKILTILNQECGACQCTNCTPHWEIDGLKGTAGSPRREEKLSHQEKKESKKHKTRENKTEKVSALGKGGDKDLLIYQASATPRSPMSGRRSSKREESDSAKKSNRKMKKKEKLDKLNSLRVKKDRDNRLIISSSSSDADQDYEKDEGKRRRFKSRGSKKMDTSCKTLLSAHDKPKRFF